MNVVDSKLYDKSGASKLGPDIAWSCLPLISAWGILLVSVIAFCFLCFCFPSWSADVRIEINPIYVTSTVAVIIGIISSVMIGPADLMVVIFILLVKPSILRGKPVNILLWVDSLLIIPIPTLLVIIIYVKWIQ